MPSTLLYSSPRQSFTHIKLHNVASYNGEHTQLVQLASCFQYWLEIDPTNGMIDGPKVNTHTGFTKHSFWCNGTSSKKSLADQQKFAAL